MAAKQGYVLAQYDLGTMYELGEGMPQNFSKAREWYQLAANQGYEEAHERLEILNANEK